MIGHYLLMLTSEEEDRVLTGKLGNAPWYIRGDGCRCLVGCVEDVKHGDNVFRLTQASRINWNYPQEKFMGQRGERLGSWAVVASRFDCLCQRFGEARVANLVRERILANRARRTLTPKGENCDRALAVAAY